MKYILKTFKIPTYTLSSNSMPSSTVYRTEDGKLVDDYGHEFSDTGYYFIDETGSTHQLTVTTTDSNNGTYVCNDGYIPNGTCQGHNGTMFFFKYKENGNNVSISVALVEDKPIPNVVIRHRYRKVESYYDDNGGFHSNGLERVYCQTDTTLEQSELSGFTGDGLYTFYNQLEKYVETGEIVNVKVSQNSGNRIDLHTLRKVSDGSLFFGALQDNSEVKYTLANYSASTDSSSFVTYATDEYGMNIHVYDCFIRDINDYETSITPGVSYNKGTNKCAYNPSLPPVHFTFNESGTWSASESREYWLSHMGLQRVTATTFSDLHITSDVIEKYIEMIKVSGGYGMDFNIVVNGTCPVMEFADVNNRYIVFDTGGYYVLFDCTNNTVSSGTLVGLSM